METPADALDEFGAAVAKHVRDTSIRELVRALDGQSTSTKGEELAETAEALAGVPRDAVVRLVVEAVDAAVHYFLFLFEARPELDLVIKTPDGPVSLEAASDGLSGEMFTIDGWFAKYSTYGVSPPE